MRAGSYLNILAVGLTLSLPLLAQQAEPEIPAAPQSTLATVKPVVDLTPDANGSLSQSQMQELFRAVAAKDLENDRRQRDYTYTKREVETKLDGKGNSKSGGKNLRGTGDLWRSGRTSDRKRRQAAVEQGL